MGVRVNFDEIPERQPAPWEILVPQGWYRVKIIDVREKDSDKHGTMWRLKLEHQGEPAFQCEDNLGFTEKLLPRVQILYKACGLPHKGDFICDPTQIVGKQVFAYLKQDEYEGKIRMKPSFDGYKALEEPEIADLVRMRSQALKDVKTKDIPF